MIQLILSTDGLDSRGHGLIFIKKSEGKSNPAYLSLIRTNYLAKVSISKETINFALVLVLDETHTYLNTT